MAAAAASAAVLDPGNSSKNTLKLENVLQFTPPLAPENPCALFGVLMDGYFKTDREARQPYRH